VEDFDAKMKIVQPASKMKEHTPEDEMLEGEFKPMFVARSKRQQ
jgi:hypothetical protein